MPSLPPGGQAKTPIPTPKPPPKPAPKPQAAPTSMNPTQWAQLVAKDLGINVGQDPNAVLDILGWMPHEEPTSSWWGGFGTSTNPTRINPLNAGAYVNGKPAFGYSPTPTTGNQMGGGLGTYPTLSAAAQAAAEMLGQQNMSAALAGLKRGDSPAAFTKDINATPWAQAKYSTITPGQVEAEAQGPTVKAKIGAAVPGSAAVNQALASQTNPAVIADTAAANAVSEQLALSPQELAFQQQILAKNYGYSKQQFGIQGQQLGLNMTELQQQYNQQFAQYGAQKEQNVLSGQAITDSINNIIKQYGFQKQQLGMQTQQGRQSLAASGVYNTGTHRQFEQQQQLTGAEELAAEQYQLQGEQRARQSLGITERQQATQYAYIQKQTQNGMKNLQLQQKSLGISEAQAATQYQNALNQLNLNNLMNVDQLQSQIFALVGGSYSPLSGIVSQLQSLIPGMTGAMKMSGTGG